MKTTLNYPLQFKFKIGTFANDFIATDSDGNTLAFVRQKMLKLKEEVIVFSDESRTKENFKISANKWLDFNTVYNFTASSGETLGKIARKGWASLWKAKYELYNEKDVQDLIVEEENPFAKVMDSMLGEIPLLGFLTGYLFNPTYSIKRPDGKLVARISKEKSFWGRKFKIAKIDSFENGEELRILLGSMMMLLLERRRG
tara:strand:- start:39 stop:638 length:600 start_codon:yes stop_codon:yes gene_type:complete